MSGKSQNLFTVRLNDRYPKEATIAEYLKDCSESTGKDLAIKALVNFYESIALSASGNADKNDIERAAIRCLNNLKTQILDIITYHRLQDGVNIPMELFNWIALPIATESPSVSDDSPIVPVPMVSDYDFSALDS
jgi:hypothetical protein